jgi:RNA polymerase sigma factor FliA
LILKYRSRVEYTVPKLAGELATNVEQADLVSHDVFGLIDTIERFEPERGPKFATYAITSIRDAMIDESRAIYGRRVDDGERSKIGECNGGTRAAGAADPNRSRMAAEVETTKDQLQVVLS